VWRRRKGEDGSAAQKKKGKISWKDKKGRGKVGRVKGNTDKPSKGLKVGGFTGDYQKKEKTGG